MSQNGEAAGRPRRGHHLASGEWRQHVFLPCGDAACQADDVALEEVPEGVALVSCGGCLWAIGALRGMAETMLAECAYPSTSPSKALHELEQSKFTEGTIPSDVLARWGRSYLWHALIG